MTETIRPGQARLDEITAAVQRGDLALAFRLAEESLAAGRRDPLLYKMRGARRMQQGQLEESRADLDLAVAAEPNDFGARNALGFCLAKLGRYDDALQQLTIAASMAPAFPQAHFNRGWTLEAMGEVRGAEEAYARALALDPAYHQARANLSTLVGRRGDWVAARAQAERALAGAPGLAVAEVALAMADVADGHADAAEQRLRRVLTSTATPKHERCLAYGVLGDALDLQDRPSEAFDAYMAANMGFADLYQDRMVAWADPTSGTPGAAIVAERSLAFFGAASDDVWRRFSRADAPASSLRGHVFVVGFPRSGTTLLGQVLGSHPDVVTVDEQELLADAAFAFGRDRDGLARLAELSDAELATYRALYWGRVAKLGVETLGKVLVDKLPLNILALPLIAKLFPDAKVVVARRDPRDVVLSCLRRRFVIGPATMEFLTLESAVRLYDLLMRNDALFERHLDLQRRVHVHERLVEDFAGEAHALCAFLDLPWRAEMEGFADHARTSGVATPSAQQIVRGVNADGVGAWRRYAAELRPVLPQLEPWVVRFGYEPTRAGE
jgi:tetratricopeptide (TPR) repeat protein